LLAIKAFNRFTFSKTSVKFPFFADAIKKYNPQVVVGCWDTEKIRGGITIGAIEGPDEDFIMSYPSVKKYVMVGNLKTHGNKALLSKYNHRLIQAEWLYTRSLQKQENCIMIFDK